MLIDQLFHHINLFILFWHFNLLEIIKDYSKRIKIKLIHISTDEVYGDIEKKSDEKYPYSPSSIVASKQVLII